AVFVSAREVTQSGSLRLRADSISSLAAHHSDNGTSIKQRLHPLLGALTAANYQAGPAAEVDKYGQVTHHPNVIISSHLLHRPNEALIERGLFFSWRRTRTLNGIRQRPGMGRSMADPAIGLEAEIPQQGAWPRRYTVVALLALATAICYVDRVNI